MSWNSSYPIPSKGNVVHAGSVSSSGKKTTSGANEEITFTSGGLPTVVNSVEISAHTVDITVKLVVAGTAETNTHLIPNGGARMFEGFQLTGFIIVENGAQYSYSGGFY